MATPDSFKDRTHAGKLLAQALAAYAGRADVLVLALPRGGVPVGFAVAQALGVEFDVMLVRKLGMPGQEEYAMGAIAAGGVRVLQSGLVEAGLVTEEQIDAVVRRELGEIERRDRLYRAGRPPPVLEGRCVILVDDGIATGATLRAAVEVARRQKVARLVVAAPVGAPDSVAALAPEVDEMVCLATPLRFRAVSQWYRHFDQTSDAEVQDLLALAWRRQAGADPAKKRSGHE
ncbi:MAG TPA: phosphoribosyltransferase family protein [Telluria sp.]|nr:phosphoribosyltransferase family protein [Telluria sp.]